MESFISLKKRKWLLPLVFCILISCLLVIFSVFTTTNNPFRQMRSNVKDQVPIFVESKLHVLASSQNRQPSSTRRLPRLAYLISGSSGDGKSLRRTLMAIYHPFNQYVLHLDLEAPIEERLELAYFVKNYPLFVRVGNVRVVSRSNLVTYRGPSMVTNTLHAAAILLKEGGDWDWFINLSASDYPLVTQDDMLHTLSTIPRELNFIEHTSDIGWKEHQRAKPIIIDPAMYSKKKSDVYWVTEKRSVPSSYKLFTGSAWMMLSRPFIEYCLWGWDNLPRKVLMYYANFLSSPEGYFHTVICNAEEFRNTTVNHDLHFISWDNPPKQHPNFLTVNDYQRMLDSNAPFARKFRREDALLDKIDSEILGRKANGFVPGSWLNGVDTNVTNLHFFPVPNNIKTLKPGAGAERFKNLINGLITQKDFDVKHCI